MLAYKTYVTITDSEKIILSGLPFKKGQRVEIVILADETPSHSDTVRAVRKLFKDTQTLPQIRELTEDDIRAEIQAYRNQ